MTNCDNKETPFLSDWHQTDNQKLEEVLKRHLPWIRSHVRKKLGKYLRTKHDSGDIVQEVIVQFLKYGPKINISDDKQLRALLSKIAENMIYHKHAWFTAQRRDMSKEKPLPTDSVLASDQTVGKQETPSQIVQQQEREAWIRLGLELLKPAEREIILMRYWKNLSFAAIGKSLTISKNGARKRYVVAWYHLIEKVKMLQGEGNDPGFNQDSPDERSS